MNILKILLKDHFTDREFGLLYDCMKYTSVRPESVTGPAGLPAHNLIIIITTLMKILIVISSCLTEDRASMISGNVSRAIYDIGRIDSMFEHLCEKDEEE